MTVTVMMAFYGAHPYVRRSVLAVLAQTYEDWRLVIVNDADPVPPWDLISDLAADPRIVTIDLPVNRGRYFADAVVFEALRPAYWALQDPDDWPEPDRFARMMPLAEEYGAAFAPTCLHRDGQPAHPAKADTTGLHLEPQPRRIRHMVGYGAGVISGERIRRAGGFHPGLRVAYDTYLMNAVRLTGPWVAIDSPALQHKCLRPGSLRTSPETGDGSPYRAQVRRHLDGLWRKAWQRHAAGLPITSVIEDDIGPSFLDEVSAVARPYSEVPA